MRRYWKNLLFVPLIVAGVLAGCETTDSASITAPSEQPAEILGLLGGGTSSGYTLLRDPLLPGLVNSISTSALIDLNGGSITLLGHTLTVPAGAVSKPTLFTLTVLPTGYVEVNLTATLSSVLGLVLNVGEDGFDKPVPVTLSYARATNVKDPSKLTIVHLKGLLGYRQIEAVPSRVDTAGKTVTADLEHFSRYSIAMP